MRFGVIILLVVMAVGCSEQGYDDAASIESAATEIAFNVEGAPTVEFDVPDMMCPEGCGAKTKEILSEQPGAKEVVIHFDAKTATVAIEEDQFNADAAVAAMVDHGFENTTVKSEASPGVAASPEAKPAG